MFRNATIVLLLVMPVSMSACAHAPDLRAILERVDVDTVLQCARLESPEDKAACLGTEVLTQAMGTALDKCSSLAKEAQSGDDAGPRTASELDQALDELGLAIANAKESSGTSRK